MGRLVCILLLLIPLAVLSAQAVGWRGDGSGYFRDQQPPLQWSDRDAIRWRVPMPNWSNASPVVVGDRVFVLSEPDCWAPVLLCLDAHTGQLQWRFELDHCAELANGDRHRGRWAGICTLLRDVLELRGEELWVASTKPKDAQQRLQRIQAAYAKLQAKPLQADAQQAGKKHTFTTRANLPGRKERRSLRVTAGFGFATWGIGVRGERNQPAADSFQYHSFDGGNSGPTWVGHAHATPLVLDDVVIVTSAYNAVFAVDVHSGTQRWCHWQAPERSSLAMEYCTSPLPVRSGFIIQMDASLRCFNKSGTVLWKVATPPWTQHKRTDLCVTTVGDREVIIHPNGHVYDAADGRDYGLLHNVIGKGGGHLLAYGALVSNVHRVVRLSIQGDGLHAETLHRWGGSEPKEGQRYRHSFPGIGQDFVVANGSVYTPLPYDMETGNLLQKGTACRHGGCPQVFTGTHVYILSWRDGKDGHQAGLCRVYDVQAGKIVASNRLSLMPADDKKLRQYWRNGEITAWRHFGSAAPFLAHDRIYIRSYDELICIGQ